MPDKVNVGASPGDGSGEAPYLAWGKYNALCDELGVDPAGSYPDLTTRLTAIEAAGVGTYVQNFGTDASTDDVVTGWTSRPHGPVPVATRIVSVSVCLHGGVGGGVTDVDVEVAPTRTGPWQSAFDSASNRPRILTGADAAVNGAIAFPDIPAGGQVRVKVLSAPTSGATPTFRGSAAANSGTLAGPSSVFIPVGIAGLAAGDLMASMIFCAQATVTWPSGWTPMGSPLPVGINSAGGGPFYLHVASKTATASESTSQAVTFTSSRYAIQTVAVSGAALSVLATEAVAGTAVTSRQEPAFTTTVDGTILLHVAALRTLTGEPGTVSWDGGVTVVGQTGSAATGSNPNFCLALARETDATAGAGTRRTASSASAWRSVFAVLAFAPATSTAPKGLMANVMLERAA